MVCKVGQGDPERLAEPVCEHEVEEVVHVLGQSLTDGASEHADAVEDSTLSRRVLAPARELSDNLSPSGARSFKKKGAHPRKARPSLIDAMMASR